MVPRLGVMLLLLASASGLRVMHSRHYLHATTGASCTRIRLSDTDDLEPDPNFPADELSRTWERTGKGKARWKPGDRTGDSALDSRLLWSSWVLDPLELHVCDGLHEDSLACALVLGWLQLPFRIIAYGEADRPGLARKAGTRVEYRSSDQNAPPFSLPRLSGKGLPGNGLV